MNVVKISHATVNLQEAVLTFNSRNVVVPISPNP
jgi:hypothetical protein